MSALLAEALLHWFLGVRMQNKTLYSNVLFSYGFMAAGALFALTLGMQNSDDSLSAWAGLSVSMFGALALIRTPIPVLAKQRG